MTNTCVVYNCMSGSEDSDELVYLFHVPIDTEMKEKWALAIPQTKEPLTTEHLVCDKHFVESDISRYYEVKNEEKNTFTRLPYDYPRLNDAAVPSIFPGYETRPNVENPTSLPTQVVYYNDPVQDTLSDIAFYSALHDLTHHTHCHHVENFGPTQANVQPEVSHPVINSTSNDISTTIPIIPSASESVPQASTNLVTAAQPSGDSTNVANGNVETSTPVGVETVSLDIPSPPDVLTNDTAGIVDQIAAPSGDYVGNGISDHAAIVDSAISRHALISDVDASNNTTDLVNAVTDSTSGWDNVIIDEPVAGIITTSTPFVSSGTKVDADGNDDCCGDDCCGEDCCGDDCCGDGCCDDCGDCDCGDECTIM